MDSSVGKVEELRRVTREANAVLKDLRLEHNALKATLAKMERTRAVVLDTVAEFEQSIRGRVEKAVQAIVDGELKVLRDETLLVAREAKTHIYEQFDLIGREILNTLGGTETIAQATKNLRALNRGPLVSPVDGIVPPALRSRSKQERVRL